MEKSRDFPIARLHHFQCEGSRPRGGRLDPCKSMIHVSQISQGVTSRRSTSHVTQTDESCHIDALVTSHRPTSHIKKSHITQQRRML